MEEEKKIVTDKDDGLDERIRNTANVLADFVKENLDKEGADEILSILSGIVDDDK